MNKLNNIDKILSSAGKELPFDVPKNYFEDFPQRIQNRCIEQAGLGRSKAGQTSFFRILKSQLSLAGGFIAMAIVATVGFYFLRPTNIDNKPASKEYIQIVQKSIYDTDQITTTTNRDSLKDNTKDEMFKHIIDDNCDYVTLMEKY